MGIINKNKMKYGVVILALMSFTSAYKLKTKTVPTLDDDGYLVMKQEVQKYNNIEPDRYSQELSNGDASDDKELEDVADKDDAITEDHGFGASRGKHLYPSHLLNVQSEQQLEMMSNA